MVTPSACVKTTIRTLAGSLSVPRLTPETTTSLPVVADAMIPPMIPLISMRLPWTICPLQSKVSSRGPVTPSLLQASASAATAGGVFA
jgi:hypothetical protein